MQKVYLGHEQEYQRMESAGIDAWNKRNTDAALDAHYVRFLEDMLAQSWCPQSGRVLEIGCGTAPMLRWFAEKGFSGMGIDVAETALRMAKQQTNDRGLEYRQADICDLDTTQFPKFDICLDGFCLHCLTDEEDRKTMLANVKSLLAPGGVFVLLTMCSPIDRANYKKQFPDQIVRDHRIYSPAEDISKYEGTRIFNDKPYIANRSLFHWESILKELRIAGFTARLTRINRHTPEEVISSIAVCATVK